MMLITLMRHFIDGNILQAEEELQKNNYRVRQPTIKPSNKRIISYYNIMYCNK